MIINYYRYLGSKLQNLQWKNIRASEKKKPVKEGVVEPKKEENSTPFEDGDVFHIIPEKVSLPPKYGQMFQFHCYSTKLGVQKSTWKLNVSIGNDRREGENIVVTVLEGTFINPSVIFSPEKLSFEYIWAKNIPLMPITKTLDITCNSELPTRFLLKYSSPFSINKEEFSLLPGKSASVKIEFDPGFVSDRISNVIKKQLIIEHIDHPFKQQVELSGKLCFPNIKLSSDSVYFGSILSETSKKQYLTMKNISEMAINYEWSFLEEEILAKTEDNISLLDNPSSKKNNVSLKKEPNLREAIPINEIFDILPLAGRLQPNEETQVEFLFNAVSSSRFKTKAVCNVEGGPPVPVEVTLLGDSSLIHYKITPNPYVIDIGEVVKFCEWTHKEFFIENTGKVLFEYNINVSNVIRKGLLEVQPSSGIIPGNTKHKFIVKICPGMPDILKEQFSIEIGYNEPEIMHVVGKGISPALLVTLPRLEKEGFMKRMEEEKKGLSEELNKAINAYYGFLEKGRKVGPDVDHIALMEKAKNSAISQMGPNNMLNPEAAAQEIEYQSDRKSFCEEILRRINKLAGSKEDLSPKVEKKQSNHELGIFI